METLTSKDILEQFVRYINRNMDVHTLPQMTTLHKIQTAIELIGNKISDVTTMYITKGRERVLISFLQDGCATLIHIYNDGLFMGSSVKAVDSNNKVDRYPVDGEFDFKKILKKYIKFQPNVSKS